MGKKVGIGAIIFIVIASLIGFFVFTTVVSGVLITAGVAVTGYIFLKDDQTKELNINEDFNIKDMGNNIIVDALDYTTSEETIKVAVTEDDINNVIAWGVSQIGLKDNKYVKKAYVDIQGTKYTFYVDLNAVILNTRLKIVTTLEEDVENESFVFTIDDVGLGKVGGIFKPIASFATSFIKDEVIDEFVESTGLSMQIDKKNLSITYKKDDLMKDIHKMMGEEAGGYFFDIIDTFIEEDVANFNFQSNNFIELNVDLTKFETNELVTDDAGHLKIQPQEITANCKNNLEALINNHAISPENDDLNLIFSYLFNGYDPLSDEEKAIIDTKDFTSIGITDNSSYVPTYASGFVPNSDDAYLNNRMNESLMTFEDLLHGEREVTLLTETDLNNYIAGRNIIGFTTLLHRNTENGYKVNYLCVDNFYSNIYQNEQGEQIAEFVLKMNVNGYHTSLTFSSEAEVGGVEDADTMTFHVDTEGIKFGSISAASLSETFFDVICDALNNGDESVSADKENHTISVHFDAILAQAKASLHDYAASDPIYSYFINEIDDVLDTVFQKNNAEIVIEGENRQAEGELNLTLKNNPGIPLP